MRRTPEAGILRAMPALHIFQILNHYTSRQELDPGFAGTTEVVLSSPSIHNSAYYLNVFEHGDAEHLGLEQVAVAATLASHR